MVQDLTDDEIQRLDSFLMSDRSSEDGMQLSDLDGFLTAVVSSPNFLMPSRWLPRVWGNGRPNFASMAEAEDIIGLIMKRYNFLRLALSEAEDAFEPLFWQNAEGTAIAMDWAEGYLDGIEMDPVAWGPLLDSAASAKMIEPIASFWDGPKGMGVFQRAVSTQVRVFRKMTPLVRDAAISVFRYWQGRKMAQHHP